MVRICNNYQFPCRRKEICSSGKNERGTAKFVFSLIDWANSSECNSWRLGTTHVNCESHLQPWSVALRQVVSFSGFDGSSKMWLRSFCILRRPFSALHTPSSDFIALPLHSTLKTRSDLPKTLCKAYFLFESPNRIHNPLFLPGSVRSTEQNYAHGLHGILVDAMSFLFQGSLLRAWRYAVIHLKLTSSCYPNLVSGCRT